MAGSAREEAERLVATVLAMAAQSGLGGGDKPKDDTLSGTAHRVTEGLGALGETLTGMVGQLTGMSGGSRGTRPSTTAPSPADTTATGPGAADAGGPAGSAAGHTGNAVAGAGTGWATGSAECCVCPLCRVIASLRDPTPEKAERLATGAGDLAAGVASMMRAVSVLTSNPRPKPARPARPAPPTPDEAWSVATRRTEPSAHPHAETPADSAEAGRREGASSGEPPAGADVWAAASAADAATVATDRRAAAERKAARNPRAPRAAGAPGVRTAAVPAGDSGDVTAAATVSAVDRPGGVTSAGAVAGGELSGVDAGSSAPAAGSRTDDVVESAGVGPAPDSRVDVWAAATMESGVASRRTVDHDVAGRSGQTGPAGTRPAPAAAPADGSGFGGGDGSGFGGGGGSGFGGGGGDGSGFGGGGGDGSGFGGSDGSGSSGSNGSGAGKGDDARAGDGE